ncbi:hypothetical protein [Corynebacterium tapiri]|nr:hypothetical protein [Corynebacterium tapiri]
MVQALVSLPVWVQLPVVLAVLLPLAMVGSSVLVRLIDALSKALD